MAKNFFILKKRTNSPSAEATRNELRTNTTVSINTVVSRINNERTDFTGQNYPSYSLLIQNKTTLFNKTNRLHTNGLHCVTVQVFDLDERASLQPSPVPCSLEQQQPAAASLCLLLPFSMDRSTPTPPWTPEELTPSAAAPELATLVRALDPLDRTNSVSAKPHRRQRRAAEVEARGMRRRAAKESSEGEGPRLGCWCSEAGGCWCSEAR